MARSCLLVRIMAACLLLVGASQHLAGQTTGLIIGKVRDASGAVIPGAEVHAINQATGERWQAITEQNGNFSLLLLPPGLYEIKVTAKGFKICVSNDVPVKITETSKLDLVLAVGDRVETIVVEDSPPLLQTDGPQLGRVVDSDSVVSLPLASRNFTQLLTLSPGTATYLPDSTAVGRNTQAISVNGARVTQNYFQINGVDATTMGTNGVILVAVPAPETIEEFKVQTSLYDASFGRSGGANIQLVTKGGSNALHGDAYEYFRNEALDANNPFLNAAGLGRPLLRRNVFGGVLGGPVRKERVFFFVSYQGSRERNAASIINSISSNVLIAQGLTNDRSAATLEKTFNVSNIDPASLALLNAKLPTGQFVIPTPQAKGLFSGSSSSNFQEDQFNTNVDFQISSRNSLAVKFFFANTSQFLALPSFRGTGPNVPGYGTDQTFNNRLVALQDIHFFSPTLANEVRLGYAFNSNNTIPEEPVTDSEIGISRPNANELPGLSLIRIAPTAGGVIVGTPTNITPATPAVTTLADALSILRGNHTLRTGFEIRYNEVNFTAQNFTRGQIDFADFHSFLTGTTQVTTFGDGLNERSQRAWDYGFFFQDDWKIGPRLTLNWGLRYELDLPVYDTRGRLTTFDPSLYVPRLQVQKGSPIGPPVGGFVQAGNVIPSYDLPDVPNVSKYVVRSIDPNNLAPRIGFSYSPFRLNRSVIRGGYGIYYSPATFAYASASAQLPPMFVLGVRTGAPFDTPFFPVPAQNQFPTFVPGVLLAGPAFDRGLRTPFVHQYNLSVQYEILNGLLLETAYVGARGQKLFRQIAINQSQLATPQNPVTNVVTGQVFESNSPNDAQLRAPLQGVSINGFSMNESTADSSYDSLQMSLIERLSHGLQFLAAYTFAKSIDNASGLGGGPGIAGLVNTGAVNDTSQILGNQNSPRANRGLSDFDRAHRFVFSFLWDLPKPEFASRSKFYRLAIWNWETSGILTAMSGLPTDIVDTGAGSLYGLANGANPLARPSLVNGMSCQDALRNVPNGYFFTSDVFARPQVAAGQSIPSSDGAATASAPGTDIGNVGRNCLRGPRQVDVDLSVAKVFPFAESRSFEFRADFFNLLNHVNFANPISNLNALFASGGSIDPATGQVLTPGNFGRIISTSNNSRIIQFGLKFNF